MIRHKEEEKLEVFPPMRRTKEKKHGNDWVQATELSRVLGGGEGTYKRML